MRKFSPREGGLRRKEGPLAMPLSQGELPEQSCYWITSSSGVPPCFLHVETASAEMPGTVSLLGDSPSSSVLEYGAQEWYCLSFP